MTTATPTMTLLALAPVAPPGADKFTTIMGWALYIASAALILAVIASGAYFGFEKMTSGSTRMATMMLLGSLVGMIVIVSATGIFTAVTGWSLFG